MKKTHIIAVVIIAVAIASIFTMLNNSSTYSDFEDAKETDPDESVHIAGTLVREKPMEYRPELDPNKFSFFMADQKGNQKKVVLLKAKPQDFERSQQVVIIGKMKGDYFEAKDVLMKCPSKYNDGKNTAANP